MCRTILTIFRRHSLFVRLRGRRELSSVGRNPSEKVLLYISHAGQPSTLFKVIGIPFDDDQLTMAH